MNSDLPSSSTSTHALEIAHVLFMDIVAYSQLPTGEQTRLIELLQQTVRNNAEFIRSQKRRQLIVLPTGDGMALVFFGDPEAPARCALEISRALRERPELKLRIGIHTGPVQRVADINANRNVAGGGINIAQRVMDCGDAGHILVSAAVADMLNHASNWNPMLHDLGDVQVKHGVTLHVYNLCSTDVGNRDLPQKVQAARTAAATAASQQRRKKVKLGVIAAGIVAALGVAGVLYSHRARALTNKDTIILADFANSTGDQIFDDTLKTALDVSLWQSPFLKVLPDSEVTKTLKQMTRAANTKLTPEVAREVCQRSGCKAYLAGSIASLGSEYVLDLKAVNCQSGDTLAQQQVTAASKEKVLDTLGEAASKVRAELGESLASVQKFDVPPPHLTTPSLEALKAYSVGSEIYGMKGAAAALPYHQRAVEIDPNFAMGYDALGVIYNDLGERARASENYTKAFQLGKNAGEREKLGIAADYYSGATGELYKAVEIYQEEIEAYPRGMSEYVNLGTVLYSLGEFEKAAEITRRAMRIEPDRKSSYGNLANYEVASKQFDDVRQTIHEARLRKMDGYTFHNALYGLAFLDKDSAAMAEEQRWFASHPDYADSGLALSSDTAAYSGHLQNARQLTKQAVDTAVREDNKEDGAVYLAIAAQREAAYGIPALARRSAAEALRLAPTSEGAEGQAAFALAMATDTTRAKSLAQDLSKRFPLHTQIQSLWLPAIQAQLALDEKNWALALSIPQAPSPLELGAIPSALSVSCLYPLYVRGEAYVAAGQGGAAATEFQKILDHGEIVWNCWTGALARLGLARANALQSRTSPGADADAARLRALAAYKDFLMLWKDADPDIPIYKAAKAEYAKLQ